MNRRLLQSLSREHVGSFAWRGPAALAKGAEEGEHIVHKYRQNGSEIDEFPSAVINNSFVRPSITFDISFIPKKKEKKQEKLIKLVRIRIRLIRHDPNSFEESSFLSHRMVQLLELLPPPILNTRTSSTCPMCRAG